MKENKKCGDIHTFNLMLMGSSIQFKSIPFKSVFWLKYNNSFRNANFYIFNGNSILFPRFFPNGYIKAFLM